MKQIEAVKVDLDKISLYYDREIIIIRAIFVGRISLYFKIVR